MIFFKACNIYRLFNGRNAETEIRTIMVKFVIFFYIYSLSKPINSFASYNIKVIRPVGV